jgi:hypothetical protein
MVREYVIGVDQTECEVSREAEVDSAAGHESECIVRVEEFRREAVAAGQKLCKRGNVMNVVREFGASGNVVEGGVVESFEWI